MSNESPYAAGFCQPAEWQPHASTWLAWPAAVDLWLENLEPALRAVSDLANAIAAGEQLNILVADARAEAHARRELPVSAATFHRVPYGDIWMRDIAPVFLRHKQGSRATARFGFNGWGEKYVLEHDSEVAERVARLAKLREFAYPWILEGGSIDADGEGTALTTRQCLLNPNRNPSWSAQDVENGLREALGIEKVLWLDRGLENDHTDGHIDNLARFVAPATVVAMRPSGDDDPNAQLYRDITRALEEMSDHQGRKLTVISLPSPGRVLSPTGEVMPASYANFYVANAAVIMPTYRTRFDEEALRVLEGLFPGRRIVGVDARALLSGGGAFHCITQQEPA